MCEIRSITNPLNAAVETVRNLRSEWNTFSLITCNIYEYVRRRELGFREAIIRSVNFEQEYLLTHGLMREKQIDLGFTDKIFCSKWLNNRHIAFGTKCNKLLIYDTHNRRLSAIPNNYVPFDNSSIIQGGLHAMDVNPSQKFLATSAYSSNDIAVYHLPEFSPVCVGQFGHNDMICGMSWLDDEFLISGSKDSQLTLWNVREYPNMDFQLDKPPIIDPICSTECSPSGKGVRALCYNKKFNEVAVLCSNGILQIFDPETFKEKRSRKLPYCPDSVSIACHREGLYAVGCRLFVLILDPRTLETIKKITTRFHGCGIRTISFQNTLLTIGTGLGKLLFYDIRAQKFLRNVRKANSPIVTLNCSKGRVYSEDEFDGFQEARYTPTIYTHCYDSNGLRLFTAGGPLPSALVGNYAAIWE